MHDIGLTQVPCPVLGPQFSNHEFVLLLLLKICFSKKLSLLSGISKCPLSLGHFPATLLQPVALHGLL